MFSEKSQFKKDNPYEKRKLESSTIMQKYKNRIPIIVELADNTDFKLDKKKYLVPSDLSVSQFIFVIRKRIKLESEKALFVLFNNTLPPASDLLSSIYEKNKDSDGFLYCIVSSESTFG